jgi:non-heme chloroperoxidase
VGYATANDGESIFSKDSGISNPVVFSRGWPLNRDAWGPQMVHLASHRAVLRELVRDARLNVYEGASHGLFATHVEQFNRDLLDFIKS